MSPVYFQFWAIYKSGITHLHYCRILNRYSEYQIGIEYDLHHFINSTAILNLVWFAEGNDYLGFGAG